MNKLTLGAIALAASTMIGSTASHATFIIQGWTDSGSAARMAAVEAASLNATIAQATTLTGAGFTPDVTATTNAINYFAPPGSTPSAFLANGGTACVGTGCGLALNNSYFLLTSTDAVTTAGPLAALPSIGIGTQAVTAGNVGVRHDDGVQLDIVGFDAIEISSPGPTANIFQEVPFPAGSHPVNLSYGENSGLPAVLQANLTNAAVPEPASLALLGSALVGFGLMRRRRKTV